MISLSPLDVVFVFFKKPKVFPRMPDPSHKSIIHKGSDIITIQENKHSNIKSITYGWARSLYVRIGTALFRDVIAINEKVEGRAITSKRYSPYLSFPTIKHRAMVKVSIRKATDPNSRNHIAPYQPLIICIQDPNKTFFQDPLPFILRPQCFDLWPYIYLRL